MKDDLNMNSESKFKSATILWSAQRRMAQNGQTLTPRPKDSCHSFPFCLSLAPGLHTQEALETGEECLLSPVHITNGHFWDSIQGTAGNSGFFGIYEKMLKTTTCQEFTRRWEDTSLPPALLIISPPPPPPFYHMYWVSLEEENEVEAWNYYPEAYKVTLKAPLSQAGFKTLLDPMASGSWRAQ